MSEERLPDHIVAQALKQHAQDQFKQEMDVHTLLYKTNGYFEQWLKKSFYWDAKEMKIFYSTNEYDAGSLEWCQDRRGNFLPGFRAISPAKHPNDTPVVQWTGKLPDGTPVSVELVAQFSVSMW